MNRPIPIPLDSERAILGCILQDGSILDAIGQRLSASDFHRPDHAALFGLMRTMHARGDAVDLVTVPERVVRSGNDERYGGVLYVTQLGDRLTSSRNWKMYARSVRLGKLARDADDAAAALREALRGDDALDEAIRAGTETLSALLDQTRTGRSPISTMRETKDRALQRLQSSEPDRVVFCIEEVQKRVGRMPPAALTIIGATPGTGKTALAMQQLASTDAAGGLAGFVSLEMDGESVGYRSMAHTAGVDLGRITRVLSSGDDTHLSGDDWDRLLRDRDETSDRTYICDPSARDLAQLCGYARHMHRRAIEDHGRGLDLLVVDYAQMITVASVDMLSERMKAIAYGLVALAKELRCHVVLLSQLKRSGEEAESQGRSLNPSMLYGGGGTNEAATNTLLMAKGPDGVSRLLYVCKARWGSAGGPPEVLSFDGSRQRFLSSVDEQVEWIARGSDDDWPEDDAPPDNVRPFG